MLCKRCHKYYSLYVILLDNILTNTYTDYFCRKCSREERAALIIQKSWKRYKDKQQKWKAEVIYDFINKIVHHSILERDSTIKGALYHSFLDSNYIDIQTIAKMQNVINVYN